MMDRGTIIRKLRKTAMRCVRSDSGAALVEMAISSTVVLATFVSVFQLTLACYHYNTVAEVARESARWAAVRGSTCSTNTPNLDHCNAQASDIQTYAKTVGAMNWSQCTTSNPCVTVSWKAATTTTGVTQQQTTWATCGTACNAPGNMVVVTMTYPYSFSIPFFKQYSLNLSSTSETIVSQ